MGPGPLSGVRVVEFAGLGPAPFAGMMLADMGADVIRVDRVTRDHETSVGVTLSSVLERGRRSVALDLKRPEAVEAALRLVASADVAFEGFRPGVAERLGLGPDECLARNPALVYGRMTGWGQTGPLAADVGHDLTYVALAGALGAMGHRGGPPAIPLNLVGDLGGGGMFLAFGIVCGVLHARATGVGQVVDAAMVDGVAALMAPFISQDDWGPRGTNSVDGGSHFYNVYETSDGEYVAIASLEPPFYAALLEALELDAALLPAQMDESSWPAMTRRFATLFAARTRAEWEAHMAGRPVCFAPVLGLDEAPLHPHLVERGVYRTIGGLRQPMPAPRFQATPTGDPTPRPEVGADGDAVLAEAGVPPEEIASLRRSGALL